MVGIVADDPDYSSPRRSRIQRKRRVAKYVHPQRTLDTAVDLDYKKETTDSDGSDGSCNPIEPLNPGDTEASGFGEGATISLRGWKRTLFLGLQGFRIQEADDSCGTSKSPQYRRCTPNHKRLLLVGLQDRKLYRLLPQDLAG